MKTVNLFKSLTREKLQTIKGGIITTSKHTTVVDLGNEDDEDDDEGGCYYNRACYWKNKH
ncbi:hypothetical protein CXF68_07430 [Tenacibaculum sp. Bg11-29]|uniref:hypothetical protein n=1 Tax=Tenacibaculum sp. Bg11-29 TaxID=2058306 RepID=UPI000C34411F|nr:hypothetical protein [Tenacibaculum sp. Bg11-29]PKH50537.1 hypothetical protein CXF68_07430 [Tenacibaculum sp. Bg11-29]